MHSTIWGWMGWQFMHIISYSFPNNPTNEDKTNYIMFYRSIGEIIPCKVCRQHYLQRIRHANFNTNFISRDVLTKWLVHLHNNVNIGIRKSHFTYKDATTLYYKYLYQLPYYTIFKFIDILTETLPTVKCSPIRMNAYIKFITSLQYIFPTEIVKTQLQNVLKKNPFKTTNISQVYLLNWYNTYKQEWQDEYKYVNLINNIKYVKMNTHTKRADKIIFKHHISNIKKLLNVEYDLIPNSNPSLSNVYIKYEMNDGKIDRMRLIKKNHNIFKITHYKLFNPVDKEIRRRTNLVPPHLR
jgi:hypothetical protein